VAAVARDGEAIELHLLKKRPEIVEKWRVCSRVTAQRVADGMKAVTEPGGTAWSVYRGRHDWPSKTGSAEVAGAKETDAWFVGYAPRQKPALAFVVWAEEDGTGSGLAQSLELSPLIEQFLRSIGIVENPVTVSSSRRSRNREHTEEKRDWLDQLMDRPEVKQGQQFLENLRERIDRASRQFGDLKGGEERLSR
jgi:membrane peptidoglycan carboxypeptidase